MFQASVCQPLSYQSYQYHMIANNIPHLTSTPPWSKLTSVEIRRIHSHCPQPTFGARSGLSFWRLEEDEEEDPWDWLTIPWEKVKFRSPFYSATLVETFFKRIWRPQAKLCLQPCMSDLFFLASSGMWDVVARCPEVTCGQGGEVQYNYIVHVFQRKWTKKNQETFTRFVSLYLDLVTERAFSIGTPHRWQVHCAWGALCDDRRWGRLLTVWNPCSIMRFARLKPHFVPLSKTWNKSWSCN